MPELNVNTLRRAAAQMRETANAATPGPWTSLDNGDRLIHEHDDGSDDFTYVVDEPMSNGANAAHIAAWHPGVAPIVADMLDAAADDFAWVERHNAIDPDNDGRTRIMPHHLAVAALNIARVYLGEADA